MPSPLAHWEPTTSVAQDCALHLSPAHSPFHSAQVPVWENPPVRRFGFASVIPAHTVSDKVADLSSSQVGQLSCLSPD